MKLTHFIILTLSLALSVACQNEQVEFYDDFESYSSGTKPGGRWTTAGSGVVIIDDSFAYSGKKSVHIVAGEGYTNRGFIELNNLTGITDNHYFGSMKMFVQEASPDGIHWTMIQSSGKVPDSNFTAEIRYGGQHDKKLMANYDTGSGVKSDCWHHSSVKIPEGEWFEVQWEFNGLDNTMNLWLDNKLINDLTVKGQGQGCVENGTDQKWLFPIMEKISLGWVDYQTGGGTRHLWIDDVIISNRRIQ